MESKGTRGFLTVTQMTTGSKNFFQRSPKREAKFSRQSLAKGVALKYRMLFSGNITCWVVVSNMFYVHPHFGKIPILTNIFQMGWNHQLAWFHENPQASFVGAQKSHTP